MLGFLTGLAKCPSLSVQDLKAQLDSSEPVYILDVREPDELTDCRFITSVNIPMGKIKENYALIPHDKKVVVICRSGSRSARIVWLLMEHGFKDVKNLDGGIIEWIAKYGNNHIKI